MSYLFARITRISKESAMTLVVRSIAPLDQAAVDAVRQWRFTPVRLNGVAVPVVAMGEVHFSLK